VGSVVRGFVVDYYYEGGEEGGGGEGVEEGVEEGAGCFLGLGVRGLEEEDCLGC